MTIAHLIETLILLKNMGYERWDSLEGQKLLEVLRQTSAGKKYHQKSNKIHLAMFGGTLYKSDTVVNYVFT